MNNEVWKEFAAHGVSHSVAHYLTTILDLRQRKGYAILKDVADELQVTRGSASVQLKNLKEKGLVAEVDRHHLKLTDDGKREALTVIYNRRVMTCLLHSVLGVDATQAEVDACKVEHLLSRDASHRLLALVQLLQSEDAFGAEFQQRFRDFRVSCPGHDECKLCGDVCMVEND